MNVILNKLEIWKQNLVNKQHYIPCCYSKNFSKQPNLKRNSMVYKLNCSDWIISEDNVENLFISESNRYSLLKNWDRNDCIEHELAGVETKFSKAYSWLMKSIINKNLKWFSKDSMENIIVFITFLNHRYDSFYDESSSRVKNENMNELSKKQYITLMSSQIEVLESCKWNFFISSDKPVILVDKNPVNLRNFTLRQNTSQIYFPINKNYCLRFSDLWQSEFRNFTNNSIIKLNLEDTKKTNYYIYKWCIKECFSHNKNLLRNYYKLLKK